MHTTLISRRSLLAAAPGAVMAAGTPALAAGVANSPTSESPELVAAYADFVAACAVHRAAVDAMEWLADEWRHRWPLAPDRITWPSATGTDKAETGIVGRPLTRPESGKVRGLQDLRWLKASADGDHALQARRKPSAARLARRAAALAERRKAYEAGVAYYAETARLREISGGYEAKARTNSALAAVHATASMVASIPALTFAGITYKAEALNTRMGLYGLGLSRDVFGEGVHLARDILALGAETRS